MLTAALAPTPAARTLVPGTWLLLYGAGLAAAGIFSLPVVSITGCAFMLFGTFALALPGWGMAWLAAGFGGTGFMQLEAEEGRLCLLGGDEVVLVVVARREANVGLIRVEMLRVAGTLA